METAGPGSSDVHGRSTATGMNDVHGQSGRRGTERCSDFKMPLHYPRYTRADYEAMPEWQLDVLLAQYGLPVRGDLAYKRDFAMGAFLWPPH